MEKVNWKVNGMTCTNCALTIDRYLHEKGMQDVKVNFMGGDLSFTLAGNADKKDIAKGIEGLGYSVVSGEHKGTDKKRFFHNHLQRFLFCLVFTLPLLLHMIPGVHIHALMNPWLQLALTLPVFWTGMDFFGRSALKSISKGVPNMNVLIALGAVSSFIYSLYGTLSGQPGQYMFYETTATILTLVFLGNWLEDRSVQVTQASLRKLTVDEKLKANMIAYDEAHNEHIFPVEAASLKTGDLLLIKTGETVPADCKVLWGEAGVSEAVLTGESVPVDKKMNDTLVGGSIVVNGTVKAYVTAAGNNTVLSTVLAMARDAQTEKPPLQLLADKISAVFVPAVIGIAVLTFLINYFFAGQTAGESLLRSIAVLVISCPCAMGLATPAAIAVGLGRGARNGILYRNAKSLELFRSIRQVVFDKTGTLTTGSFTLKQFHVTGNVTEDEFKKAAYSLEKYAVHPVARPVVRDWKVKDEIRWAKMEEVKGIGVTATDREGNRYQAGSYRIAASLTQDAGHNIYVVKNDALLGWIDVEDELRPEAQTVINWFRQNGVRTILLSGDSEDKCRAVAGNLGIDQFFSEQSPAQKLAKIRDLAAAEPTAMVGDGINDAPALAAATIGISISDATQIAMQHAQVVLMNQGLKNLPAALVLGRHTYTTIRQNLFWAFAYNIIAIPVAALGFLNPAIGALFMGFSDVVLALNSLRLNFRPLPNNP